MRLNYGLTNNRNMRSTQRSRVQQNRKQNPVSYNTRLSPTTPGIPRVARGKDIIVERVLESTTFKSFNFILNPKFSGSFPSASLSAQRYDMYEFEELEFRYHPTRAVTNTPGVVFLGWEPNANRGAPEGVKEINAYEYHTEGPSYSPNIVLKVGKQHLPPARYCRDGPTTSDLNLYDTGSLVVCTDAFEANSSAIGYVEVHYKLRFYNYHLDDTSLVQNRILTLAHNSGFSTGANVPQELPLFTTGPSTPWMTATGTEARLSRGVYLLTWPASVLYTGSAQAMIEAEFTFKINGIPVGNRARMTATSSGGRANGLVQALLYIEEGEVLSLEWQASVSSVDAPASAVMITVLS